jgi:hypothetical protein
VYSYRTAVKSELHQAAALLHESPHAVL